MEAIAIISHLLHYVLGILAVCFCITLFSQERMYGWLLVSLVFCEPFVLLIMRAVRGHPLFSYKTMSVGSDGVMQVSYRMDFPILYCAAVVGLFLLVRESRKK